VSKKDRQKAYREANREKIAKQRKAYREANRERDLAKNKAYREAHQEELAAKQKAFRDTNREELARRCKAYREANPEQRKAYREANRARIIARRLKLNEGDVQTLFETRDKCEICGTPFSLTVSYVDHCHKSGALRGRLCGHCNRGLGHFHDNPKLLAAAIKYLKSHTNQGNIP
jgi:Recombination endonuclease VII